jgi:hypothetical protein
MKINIEKELKKIAAQHAGLLRPGDVLAAAKSNHHPLHKKFCWDDTKAAQEYRLWQARELIMSVRVVYEADEHQIPYRMFVSLTSDRKGSGYREVISVLRHDDRRAEMLQDAINELCYFKSKYGFIKELSEVWTTIDRIKA